MLAHTRDAELVGHPAAGGLGAVGHGHDLDSRQGLKAGEVFLPRVVAGADDADTDGFHEVIFSLPGFEAACTIAGQTPEPSTAQVNRKPCPRGRVIQGRRRPNNQSWASRVRTSQAASQTRLFIQPSSGMKPTASSKSAATPMVAKPHSGGSLGQIPTASQRTSAK